MPLPIEQYKQLAAELAASDVQSGMIVGLGHGSTAIYALRRIAARLAAGELHAVLGVACSSKVEADARDLGIPLTTLDAHSSLDLTIDGADEVSPDLSLIKGGGGALLREKIVAQASRREIIVVDASKLSPALGTLAKIPVEVIPFGWPTQRQFLLTMASQVERRVRANGEPWITDQGNYLLDCAFCPIAQPAELAKRLQARAGIVEHGLFIGLASEVIVAGPDGLRRLLP